MLYDYVVFQLMQRTCWIIILLLNLAVVAG